MNAQRNEDIKRLQFWINNSMERATVRADKLRLACDRINARTLSTDDASLVMNAAGSLIRELESFISMQHQMDALQAGDA